MTLIFKNKILQIVDSESSMVINLNHVSQFEVSTFSSNREKIVLSFYDIGSPKTSKVNTFLFKTKKSCQAIADAIFAAFNGEEGFFSLT